MIAVARRAEPGATEPGDRRLATDQQPETGARRAAPAGAGARPRIKTEVAGGDREVCPAPALPPGATGTRQS
jgi:hypothetical protein